MATNPPSSLIVFALGAGGALAPEVLRLWKLATKGKKAKLEPSYYVLSAFYAALGGVVAVILPAVTLHAAFYAGVTLPATLSVLVPERRRKSLVGRTVHNSLADDSERSWQETFRDHAKGLFL